MSVNETLARTRTQLDRLEPTEAYEAVRAGAVLVRVVGAQPPRPRSATGHPR
jgi:hypothetical protein